MKLKRMSLVNFRGYQNVEVDFDENFNVIIGKNDVGKSTILDALEIFFNNEIVKIDRDDCNVYSSMPFMSIEVSFVPEKKEYTIDTVPTDLSKEFLYDDKGCIRIKKIWDCSKDKITATSLKTILVCNYPNNFETPLVTLKITALKKILQEYKELLNVDEIKKNVSADIRQAIYEVADTTNCKLTEIPIDKAEGKMIWDAIKVDLPLFFIFQSDRANKDSDKEVQDPLRAITKTAISGLQKELDEVKEKIRVKAEELGRNTLEKLKEMNPDIANVLKPEMTNKAWDTLFSFSFKSDDGIPINKRGSGVRRLILLNYFRAEAERKNSEQKNVIYAIEEPETSQHPDWQVELFNALVELSKNDNTQVIATSHSPSLASLIETKCIRFIHKNGDVVVISSGNEDILQEIADTLGLLPSISSNVTDQNVEMILCVEGPSDVEFFNKISKLFDLDLVNDPRVLCIPLGGGTLMHWVNRNYIGKLNKPEIHIYDNDVSKYQEAVDDVNAKPNCWATLTNMLEIENYIHPSLYKNIYNINEDFVDLSNGTWKQEWVNRNVSKDYSTFLKLLKQGGNVNIRGEGQQSIKNKLTSDGSDNMTVELLNDLNAYTEVESWFNQIKSKFS